MRHTSVDAFNSATRQRPSFLAHMVATLPQHPSFSLKESLAEIHAGCLGGSIDINPDELNSVVEFCESFAAGVVSKGDSNGLTEPFIAAITLYTTEFASGATKGIYFALNRVLRENNQQMLRPFVPFLWLLLHALNLCRSAEKDLGLRLVYRGFKGFFDSSQYATGSEVVWNQFSSCSPDISVQTEFLGDTGRRILFHIELSSGRARDVSMFSAHPDESEIILPPNSRFEVTGVLPQGDLTVVHMKEVAPLDPILEFHARPSPKKVDTRPQIIFFVCISSEVIFFPSV